MHYYQFAVTGSVTAVTASIPSGSVPAGGYFVDLAILRGDTGANFGDNLGSLSIGNTGDSMTLWLDPGIYYLEVKEGDIATTVQVVLSEVPEPTSRGVKDSTYVGAGSLPPISFGQAIIDDLGILHPLHYYEFEVTGSVTAVTAAIPSGFVPAGGYFLNFQILLGNPGPDFGTILGKASADSTGNQLTLWLDPGSYFVEVAEGDIPTFYQLVLSQVPEPASMGLNDNTLLSADDLGELISPVVVNDFVGLFDAVNCYHFHLSGPTGTVTAAITASSLNAASSGVLLELMQDPTRNGVGEDVGSPAKATPTANGIITQPLGPGDYFVRVSEQNDNSTYQLTVSRQFTNGVAPFIITQPGTVTINSGQSAAFSVLADGSGTLSYQWQLDGTNIFGATNSTVSISDLLVSGIGSYQINVVLSNSVGSLTVTNGVLNIQPPDLSGLAIAPAIILSWPATNSAGYVLESAPSLAGPWIPLTRPINQLQGTFETSVRTADRAAFYRLHFGD